MKTNVWLKRLPPKEQKKIAAERRARKRVRDRKANKSIDRINPTLGYVRGNIAVIGHRFNTIKSFGTAAEHRLIAEYLEQHHAQRR
jgi:hypothetical protein